MEVDEKAAFDHECQILERELLGSRRHFRRTKWINRILKYAVGIPAVALTAISSATAFADNPEVAGWLALSGTVLGLVYASISPIKREAVYEQNEVACQYLLRQVRYLRRLESDLMPPEERIAELKRLSERYRDVGTAIARMDLRTLGQQ
jgi:hypothetical protein